MPQPKDAEKVYVDAEEAETFGRFDQAERLYLEFMVLSPDDPRGPNKVGVCYAKRLQFDQAERMFQQALDLDAKYPPALTNMGNIMLEHKNLESAVAYYEEALRYDPNYAPAHNNLAAALKRMGKLHPAVQHLRQAQRGYRNMENQKARQQMTRGCVSRGNTTVILLVATGIFSLGVFWR